MNCSQARPRIAPLADGQIADGAEVRALREHLQQCEECAAQERRWRALRDAARRGMAAPAPSALRSTVLASIAVARAAARRKTLRLVSVLASAAAIVLLVSFWPRTAVARVEAVEFVRAHEACAIVRQHSIVEKDKEPCAHGMREILQQRVPFRVVMPRLEPAGYELVAACDCSPASSMRAVHATYRASAAASAASAAPGRPAWLSIFSADRRVDLLCSGKECPVSACDRAGSVQVARVGNATVIRLNTDRASVVLCADTDEQTLRSLAGRVSLASGPLDETTRAALAMLASAP